MKSKRLLLMLLIALIAPWAAMGQSPLTIGTGTSYSSTSDGLGSPMGRAYYYNSAAQFIYTADELASMGGAQAITSVAFYHNAYSYTNNIKIYLAHTTATTVDPDNPATTPTLVYSGTSITIGGSSEGWQTFTFDNPFNYNGTDNLLVVVCRVNNSSGYSSSQTWQYTETTDNKYMMRNSDTQSYGDITNTSYSYTASTKRPNIQIAYEAIAATPKPSGLAVSNVLHNQADLSWTENGTATSWQICLNDDETNLITTTENPYTLSNLTPLTAYTVKVRSVGTSENSPWSNAITFSTSAVAEVVGDSWSDDFEGNACGWELVNGTLTNANWAWGPAVNNGGTHAIYISNDGGTSNNYNNSGYAKVFATKLLNFTEGKFIFSYDWKGTGESSYDFMRVALVPASQTLTAGTDYSTIGTTTLPSGWIALDGGNKLNQQSTWTSKEVTTNVTAGNYYLVLAWRQDNSGGSNPPAAVDNVSITRMACPYDVTGLAVSNIATTTADIAWTNGDPGEWQVATKTGNGEWITLPNTYTTNSATLTGLTAATTYQVRVRAYCNANDQGEWCDPITFTTECEAIDLSLQDYSENFDSYTASTGFLPVCWSRINEGTSYTTYPYVNGYNAHSTSNCLYFYTYGTSGSDQYAILPAMENMEGKQITLWAKGYNGTSSFKVGTMTDPTDATTFEEIAEQTLTTSYEEYSFILGRGNYVAIMMETPTSSTTKGVYIDDITIADVPACAKPSDLTFVSATTTSATIGWTIGGNENAWQIAYSTDPAFDPDEVTPVDVTSNPGTIDGLTAATTYYAYVRANCGNNGYSDWSNAYCMFTTECDAITNLPWSENFDAYTGSTGTTAPAGYPNDQLPTCWQFLNRSENSSNYPQVFISSNSGYPVSGKCLFFKSSSTTPLYAILPEFSEDIANLLLTFTYRNEGTTTSNGTLIVGYMTDPTDTTTFTSKHTCEQTQTLTEVEVLLTDAPAGSYIAFKYQGGTSNNYYLSIDNVSVNYPPTCLKPTDLVFVSATTTSATLGWTAGGTETAWQIAYSTDPAFDPDEVTPVDVTSNPGIISGLTASTTYYAYVRANCGNDGYSDWSISYVQFATACEAITDFPVSYNFETSEGFPANASTPTTNQLGACWRNEATVQNGTNATRVWGTSTSYKHEGSQALVLPDKGNSTDFAKTMLVFPEMVFTSERGYTVSFWINRNGTNSATANPEGFKVYISDTDTISANAVELGHYSRNYGIAYPVIESASGWYQYEIEIPKSMMTGNVFLIFEGQSYYGSATYVDEVVVKETPTCQTPSGLALVSSTTTEATLSWTAVGTETAWQIAYSTDPAFDPDEVTPTNVTSNPGIISGLTASTTYYAYVRANCGNDDYSEWSNPISFATECDVHTLPYTYGFEEGIGCWTMEDCLSSTGIYADAHHDGNNGFRFYYVANSQQCLISPEFECTTPMAVSFYYKNYSSSYDETFHVGYSTTTNDVEAFTWGDEITADENDWMLYSNVFPAGTKYVAIKHTSDDAFYLYVDDFSFQPAFTKTIVGYDTAEGNGYNYYLIASPLADDVDPATVGMITDDWGADAPTPEDCSYDFYRFDEALDLEWVNYRGNEFNMVNGHGYLYASKEGTTITFTGVPYSGTPKEVTLNRTGNDNADFQGWNLVGNPFAAEAYIIGRPFYVMDPDGMRILSETPDRAIQPMEGVFVIAEEDGDVVTFTTEAPGAKANIVLNLAQGFGNTVDRAIVSVGQGRTLPKFMLNPDDTKLYMPQNGEDYAVVRGSNSGNVPVNFEPAENGAYSISVDVRNVNLSTLILKDKVRNVSIDLLRTPTYYFKASTADRADRFALSFRANSSIYKEKIVKGANPEGFGFYSNGNWIIDNEGEATLQVIDLNGRVLSSENIYGSTSIQVDAAPGVYMLRLINGDNVKTQKVVVE